MTGKIPDCLLIENLLLDSCITDSSMLHIINNSLIQEDACNNLCAIETDSPLRMFNKLLYYIHKAAPWTRKVNLQDEETG